MTKFDQVARKIEAIIAKSKVPEDPIHSKNTLKWLLKLKPDADDALKIAALGHDIDRAVETKVLRENFDNYDEFKAQHAHHSAEIMRNIMLEVQFEENVINNVYHLICQHEIGGDPRSDLIKDADSISFFDVNLPLYFQRNDWEESKRRCIWGFKRLSNKMKEEAKMMAFENEELRKLVKLAYELAL